MGGGNNGGNDRKSDCGGNKDGENGEGANVVAGKGVLLSLRAREQ